MNKENMLKFEKGEKMPKELGMGPIPAIPGNIRQQILCLSNSVFLINLQGDWSKEEVNEFAGNVTLDIADIDDMIDIILSFEESVYEIGYHSSNTAPEIQFDYLEDNKAVGFLLVVTAQDSTILCQRALSLQTKEQSDSFIDTLNEHREKDIDVDTFNKKYDKMLAEMSIEEIKSNAFIHCRFNKG